MTVTWLCFVTAVLLSGCASLPNTQRDHRTVEYALSQHNTLPVVFESPLGGSLRWWDKVFPAIAKDSTAFAYSRAGYGQSEPASSPRDGDHIVEELRILLYEKGLHPPYVLVGHSLGGLYMQLFARRYPHDVAALVLVDSTGPARFKGKPMREHWPWWWRMLFGLFAPTIAQQELDELDATGQQVMSLPTLTGKPVIILSANDWLNDTSEEMPDAMDYHEDFVHLYPGCTHIWVESGHDIPHDNPDAVITAIRDVLARVSSLTHFQTKGGYS
ncbi:MAG: alpha/beta hydrolase [Nitrospira sp.]|nr:alpha/beta hydrolase [Nitrospira sp.]